VRRDHGPQGAGTTPKPGLQVTGDSHHRGRWIFLAQPLNQLQLALRMQRDLHHHYAAGLEMHAVDTLKGDGYYGRAEPASDGLHPRRKEQVVLDEEYRHLASHCSLCRHK